MERTAFDEMAAQEEQHWWFVGRRAILKRLIERICVQRTDNLSILEAGCGSGGNLPLLAQFGTVTAFEKDSEAREQAVGRRIANVFGGYLPDGITEITEIFDLIALLDVLEHVECDIDSLTALSRKLAAEGRLVITVPALPFLWSEHDVRHHHFRRYSKRNLRHVVEAAGMKIQDIGYFNSYLFPLALVERVLSRILGRASGAEKMPHPLINRILCWVFAGERHFVGTKWHAPFGLSLYAVVVKL